MTLDDLMAVLCFCYCTYSGIGISVQVLMPKWFTLDRHVLNKYLIKCISKNLSLSKKATLEFNVLAFINDYD